MKHRVESAVRINVSAEKVWTILDDFGAVEKFSPGLKQSSIIGEKVSGLGAKRLCVFHDKRNGSVQEEIVEYDAGRRFKVELSEYSMPLKSMQACFMVSKIDDHSCEVVLCMDFIAKFGPLGALMGMLMLRPMMRSVQQEVLYGLAYHAYTGNIVANQCPSDDELVKALAV